ncbi:MAG: CoA transferase [Burkholderiaceae bacterium]
MTKKDAKPITADQSNQSPFHGYKILDFTQVISGPLAVQLLANSGAQVIKVESRTGDQMRKLFKTPGQARDDDSPSFVAANRGKRSLCIDLKTAAGVAAIKRLASQCDVLVENFRPGVAKRLGLDYDTIRGLRKDIVYCSVSGFGQNGPLAPQSAYDGGIQAVSGMMSTTGHPQSGPVRTGYLAVDVPTALHTAFAITSALLRRERTGLGQRVDVAMMDTALLMQISATTKFLYDGTPTVLAGNSSPAHSPLANTFQTKNGYLATSAVTAKHGRAALTALGLSPGDWDSYVDNPPGSEPVKRIDAAVQKAMASEATEYWEPRLRATGMSVENVNTIEQALGVARRQSRPIIDWQDDETAVASHPGYLGATYLANVDGPQTGGRAPAIGEHTVDVLAEFGFDKHDIDQLRDAGAID